MALSSPCPLCIGSGSAHDPACPGRGIRVAWPPPMEDVRVHDAAVAAVLRAS